MGLTKKVCILLFIVLGLAFFYQNHVLSQSLSPAYDPVIDSDTYITFREDLNGQTVSKYAVIDSNSNIQIRNIYTATAPIVVNPAEISKDSMGNIHFLAYYGNLYFNWGSMRVFYQKEGSTVQEIIPFPYGTGMSSNFNGFLVWSSKLVIDSMDVPHAIAAGKTYNNGQMTGTQILISKRLSTGWTTPTVLLATSTLSTTPEVSLSFDSNSNGHVFYQLFTNQNCVGVTCPVSYYELVFDRSFNVISNNMIMTFNGPMPEVTSLKSIIGTRNKERYLAFISTPNTPIYNIVFATSKNSWVEQILANSVVSIGSTYATSVDIELDNSKINIAASEKNLPAGTSKLLYLNSINNGRNWITNTLISSTTKQFRDVSLRTKDINGVKELNLAYVESNFGDIPQVKFDKLYLMKLKPGAQTNTLVYQNPTGNSLMIGDIVV